MAGWWWYSGACEQGSPFIGAQGRGGGTGRDATEGGAAGTRLRQGRVVARPSRIDDRVACASGKGGIRGAANHR
jgi:hypothetical protein